MDRKIIQAFSLGMLFVSLLFVTFLVFFQRDELDRAKDVMEQNGYALLKRDQYQNLKGQIAILKKENADLKASLSKGNVEKEEKKQEGPVLVEIEIKRGMVLNDIADLLERRNVINDKAAFVEYAIERGIQEKIQIGTFHLHEKMTFEEILSLMTK